MIVVSDPSVVSCTLRPSSRLSTWILLARTYATRAPSGSNRQPFRFLVLRDGPRAVRAKAVLGDAFSGRADELWAAVLTRKGGNYALLARMPPDPSVN